MAKDRKALPKPKEVEIEEGKFYTQLGSDISIIRLKKGYSQKDLADRLFISPGTVSTIEGGFAKIKAYELKKLCETFGITPDNLLRYGEIDKTDLKSTDYRIKAKITSMTPEEKEKLLQIMNLVFI